MPPQVNWRPWKRARIESVPAPGQRARPGKSDSRRKESERQEEFYVFVLRSSMRAVLFRLVFGFCDLYSMDNPRPRSAGVTAAATFAILGCITAMCVWGYVFLIMVNSPGDDQGHHLYELYLRAFLVTALVPPLIIAALVRTAVGLFQLRPWARTAAIAWAVLALTISLGIIALRPFETFVIPDHFVREVDSLRQLFAISYVMMLLPAGIWWLFLFRMKSVKEQFEVAANEKPNLETVETAGGAIGAHKAVI